METSSYDFNFYAFFFIKNVYFRSTSAVSTSADYMLLWREFLHFHFRKLYLATSMFFHFRELPMSFLTTYFSKKFGLICPQNPEQAPCLGASPAG